MSGRYIVTDYWDDGYVDDYFWPESLIPQELTFGIRFYTQIHVSDISGYISTVEMPDSARWTMNIIMPPLERGDAALMESFIARMRGQAIRSEMPVFARLAPRGSWAGSPVVNDTVLGSPSLTQTGTTLRVRGFTAFATFKEGDYFNLGEGGQLLMVTEDGTADSNGTATITFQPSIRTPPADGLALISTDPVVPQMILTDPHPKWRITPGDINQYALDFVETFE
jgi:hypothetical protein